MIWLITLIMVLVLVISLMVKFKDIKEWHQNRMENICYEWCIAHQDELPIPPKVINANEWVKIEGNPIVPANGIYVFLCSGDNHLLYEVHELYQGFALLNNFQENNTHGDGWFVVKPLYYYYIPFLTRQGA